MKCKFTEIIIVRKKTFVSDFKNGISVKFITKLHVLEKYVALMFLRIKIAL